MLANHFVRSPKVGTQPVAVRMRLTILMETQKYKSAATTAGEVLETINTGSASDCKGPGFAASLFDMSGNLAEWTDSCSGTTNCPVIGGSYENILDLSSCNSRIAVDVLSANADFGFRCCVLGN